MEGTKGRKKQSLKQSTQRSACVLSHVQRLCNPMDYSLCNPMDCNPMDCSPMDRLLCPWDSPGKNTGVGCHFLLQGIFLTQGLNPHLLIGRWILYHWATWEAQTRDDIKHNSDFQDIPVFVLKRGLGVLICLALDEKCPSVRRLTGGILVLALLMAVFMSKFVLLGLNIPLHPFPSLLETMTLGEISNSQMILVKIILAETLQITLVENELCRPLPSDSNNLYTCPLQKSFYLRWRSGFHHF